MAARRKTARKTAKKGARRSAARKPARNKKSGARKPAKVAKPKAAAAPAIEAMAQKIVRTMTHTPPGKIPFRELYAENATSQECGPMPPAIGLAAIEAKAAGYESQVREQKWTAKNVWARGNTVAIEWVGKVMFKNGNALDLKEVAVHDVRDGKIVAERYYYDPSAFAAAAGGGASASAPSALPGGSGSSLSSRASAPAAIASAYEEEEEEDDDETSPIDPLDL
jgi:ketosteroid isomerase-like protein